MIINHIDSYEVNIDIFYSESSSETYGDTEQRKVRKIEDFHQESPIRYGRNSH